MVENPRNILPAGRSSAAAIANEFLSLGWQESNVSPIDQMKLQKLLFYAHAWHLALFDTPLFEEDIEAWPWGPVVRDIYFQTKDFGRQPISRLVQALHWVPDAPLHSRFYEPRVGDEALKDFIRQIWDAHKDYSGIQLSNSTHAPGEPWTIIKEQYNSLEARPTIPNEIIGRVFKQKVADAATQP